MGRPGTGDLPADGANHRSALSLWRRYRQPSLRAGWRRSRRPAGVAGGGGGYPARHLCQGSPGTRRLDRKIQRRQGCVKAMAELLLSYYGDDFTGSTDVMEALASNGVPTVLFLGIPSAEIRERFKECRAIGIAGTSR